VLIDTENRMDEVIFREFKGTGNLDIVLDPQLADHRIWPAIDIAQTATRREELIHDVATHQAATSLRRVLLKMPKETAIQELATKLARFETNDAFVSLINDAR
jgi:transcription termination factor Rho